VNNFLKLIVNEINNKICIHVENPNRQHLGRWISFNHLKSCNFWSVYAWLGQNILQIFMLPHHCCLALLTGKKPTQADSSKISVSVPI